MGLGQIAFEFLILVVVVLFAAAVVSGPYTSQVEVNAVTMLVSSTVSNQAAFEGKMVSIEVSPTGEDGLYVVEIVGELLDKPMAVDLGRVVAENVGCRRYLVEEGVEVACNRNRYLILN